MIGRRAIMQLFGAAPVAAIVGNAMPNFDDDSGEMLTGYSTQKDCAPSPLDPIRRAAHDALTAYEKHRRFKVTRPSQIEPDIISMRSVSPVIKARMQYERDLSRQTILEQLQQAAWGAKDSW